VNLPFPGGFADAEYVDAFRTVIEPIAEQYAPQFVLISAGFDPHYRDPLAQMSVTEAGFAAMADSLLGVARRSANGRCVAVLEGGYDLRALRDSTAAVLDRFESDQEPAAAIEGESRAAPVLERIRRVQGRYWKL
jgi:acetoin utilization deacetylase AcuC-like enzyme